MKEQRSIYVINLLMLLPSLILSKANDVKKIVFPLKGPYFWSIVCLVILIRLALTSDLAVRMSYTPHDDGLYVSRASHLLLGEAMGPYDARLLVKLPGLSLWLAGIRFLGIPYLFSINFLYILAGVYFIAALLRHGDFNKLLLLGGFTLYLFNPVTLDPQWFRVIREPLSISLLILMLSAMIFMLSGIRERRVLFLHGILFSAIFGFALLVREEDRLLYMFLVLFYIVLIWQARTYYGLRTAASWVTIAGLIALPLISAYVSNTATRAFIVKHYGVPIPYDFGEGEFPRLIAAMRSVVSKKDNRHVMITQESLGKLRQVVPRLAPLIDRLPPPSPNSYSCQRFKVCSEWTNGWMPFWIKDAAFQAGLTPDLPQAQEFFRQARLDIEKACQDGRLQCRNRGTGLFPPFELRWTRAYVHEWRGIMKMMMQTGFQIPGQPPSTYPVDVEYGRMYQMVTMTHHYDTLLQFSNQAEAWKNYSQNLYLSLWYWLRYPDVAASKDFGPNAGGDQLGALTHYQRHGQHEGRIWQYKKASENLASLYKNPIAAWRRPIVHFYQKYGIILELLGLLAFVGRLMLWRNLPPSPFLWTAILFAAFTVFRLAALSYVSVYMGGLDGRLFFSTYVGALLIAPFLVAEAIKAMRIRLKTSKG
jgi:hypothetical protein